MSDLAKSARAAMKKKAAKLAEKSTEKVDSSDWTPAPLLNADKKTGLKPISRRAFKSGGKVEGSCGPVRADKMPRKGKLSGGALGRYAKAATDDLKMKSYISGAAEAGSKGNKESKAISGALKKLEGRADKRNRGIKMAVDKLSGSANVPAGKDEGMKKGGRINKMDGGDILGFLSPAYMAVKALKGDKDEKKSGGRIKRQSGGSTYSEGDKAKLDALVREAQKTKDLREADNAYEGRAPQPRDLYSPDQIKRLERGYKKGGRVKKMVGGKTAGEVAYAMGKAHSDSDYGQFLRGLAGGSDPGAEQPAQASMNPTAGLKNALSGGKKHGGRAKKMGGGGMDPRLGAVPTTRMKFSGAQGTPYKKGGKVKPESFEKIRKEFGTQVMKNGGSAHGDEAMDKALIRKMVKPSARTGKADGGDVKRLGAGRNDSDNVKSAEKEYGPREDALQRGMMRIENEFSPAAMRRMRADIKARRDADPEFAKFKARRKKREEAESMKEAGYQKGGRTARKDGGKVKKGKTNINIVISQPKADGMPPMPPGGPMGRMPSAPVPMPPAGPAPMGAMPVPVPAPAPSMPPATMQRKSGGRVTKVARSYADMQAGAASGEGRLQKTDIASRLPKKRENGVIETDKRGYPNKVIGATGGRTAHKAGGKVYRSYKDMDAGAGSGMGRLEKAEIERSQRGR